MSLTRSSSQSPPHPPVDRLSAPPGRLSLPPGVPAPPPEPTLVEAVGARVVGLLSHLGRISVIFKQSLGAMFRRPLELRAVLYQMEYLGVRSVGIDRKSTRLNSSHGSNSYAVFCLKKKNS